MAEAGVKNPWMKRLVRWLYPDQRVANRHAMPPLVAYLGMVRSSKEYKVGDVSVAGFYMMTDERWIVGSGVPITLERTDPVGMGQTITLYSTVIRLGPDGVGFSFLQPKEGEPGEVRASGSSRFDLTNLARFLKGIPLSETKADPLERAS
jgi:hypothetical protein